MSYGNDLVEHMLKGLVDRFLEHGYLNMIGQFAKSGDPIYCLQCHDRVEEVFVSTAPATMVLQRRGFKGSEGGYTVRVTFDMHLVVTAVKIEQASCTAIEVASDLHRVLTRVMESMKWDGEARNPVKQPTHCSI